MSDAYGCLQFAVANGLERQCREVGAHEVRTETSQDEDDEPAEEEAHDERNGESPRTWKGVWAGRCCSRNHSRVPAGQWTPPQLARGRVRLDQTVTDTKSCNANLNVRTRGELVDFFKKATHLA